MQPVVAALWQAAVAGLWARIWLLCREPSWLRANWVMPLCSWLPRLQSIIHVT